MNRLRRQRGDLSDSTHACLHQRPNQWLGLVIGILALHTADVATYGKKFAGGRSSDLGRRHLSDVDHDDFLAERCTTEISQHAMQRCRAGSCAVREDQKISRHN